MIRVATKFDLPALIQMMRDYSTQSPVAALGLAKNHNEDHVRKLLLNLMLGVGFILIDDLHRGFLAAVKTPNVWCPKVIELHELAWWVKSEHRNGTTGGRLWHRFDELAKEMLSKNEVQVVCTSLLSNSVPIDYTRRGYAPMQTTYFRD